MEAEGYNYEIDEELDQTLVIETDADPWVIAERIAMVHWIGLHLCTSPAAKDEILASLGSTDIIDLLPQGETIAVRVKRVGEHLREIDPRELIGEIADQIMEEVKYDVDLKNPDNEIVAVLSDEMCSLGIIEARVKRSEFEERKPKRRKAIHPGTMHPILARTMVNLARIPRGGKLLDPFAGVGGILIEAGIIGAKPIGIDMNPELIEGAEENLRDLGITNAELHVGDSKKVCASIADVDAIATDPPYGRQASTGGSELRELYEEVLPVLSESLKRGRYLCIGAPKDVNIEDRAREAGFKPIERHEQRVHKDLTRSIHVFRKRK